MVRVIGFVSLNVICFSSFVIFSLFQIVFTSTTQHLCRPDQKKYLLDFKSEFQTWGKFSFPSYDIKPWTNDSDCCSWSRVTCDDKLGIVIGLDLNSMGIHGTFKPNSSLFKLNHLKDLILSSNDFNQSLIPSNFGKLSELTLLDLSVSNFSGQIPNELLSLTNLISLYFTTLSSSSLFIDTLFLTMLAKNLRKLRELRLDFVNISSMVPKDLGNISSLRTLSLDSCQLLGELPGSIFSLPHIEEIILRNNRNLSGSLPQFPPNSSLRHLDLSNTNVSGSLPNSICNLKSLEILTLAFANFSEILPDCIGNLSSLNILDLSKNAFVGEIPASVENLNHLSALHLSDNKFTGNFSLGLLNQPNISLVDLSYNQLTGLVPPNNGFMGIQRNSTTDLDLSNNKIKGQVPKCLWNLHGLQTLDLSYNSFNSFEGSHKFSNASQIRTLDFRSNKFQGQLPVPPVSTTHLLASANSFTGDIPPGICRLNSLIVLDLSDNNLNGSIPRCLGNFSDRISVMKLRNNNLDGSLPDSFITCKDLINLDVGHNKLIGKLPRSLLNCINLEILNVESNRINDTFPFWLEDLQMLKILVIRSNGFHSSMVSSKFSSLQILDISHNNFSGTLPSNFFANWIAMSSKGDSNLRYVGTYSPYYNDSLDITCKGRKMKFERILSILKAVDFSGNKFRGPLPESIGFLTELLALNFSNNIFTGRIPESLQNLTQLESLDLSQNRLSGKIPHELGDLARLARINMSHNQLTGEIPQGPQFSTQDASSFEGNLRLCGRPLEETCDANTSPAQLHQQPEQEEEVLSWIAILIGCIPGLVLGATIGHIVASYKQEWFLKFFDLNMRRRIRTR